MDRGSTSHARSLICGHEYTRQGCARHEGESPLAAGLGDHVLLGVLCQRDLPPLSFHDSFRYQFVNRGFKGIFPVLVVATYMRL